MLIFSQLYLYLDFPDGLAIKNLPAMQEMQEAWVLSLGQEDHLEEEMTTHFSILAGKIPWTEEPSCTTVLGGHKESERLNIHSLIHLLLQMALFSSNSDCPLHVFRYGPRYMIDFILIIY